MTNLAFALGRNAVPGPLWDAFKVAVLAGGDWHNFEPHTLSVLDDGTLVLRKGEQLPSGEVLLISVAAFPQHGWNGLQFDGGAPADPRAISIGFKAP